MRLTSDFIQLNGQFDKQALQNEVDKLPDEAWRPHPQGFKDNSAVPLITNHGVCDNDLTYGSMNATQWLEKLPYIQQVMATFKVPLGRSRLMRIKGHAQAPRHTDLDYYWIHRMRIHIPIKTHIDVEFECGNTKTHMAEGTAWIFDTTQLHRVYNPQGVDRIHLVIDTVGSSYFFNLLKGKNKFSNELPSKPKLRFESHNRPLIMSPYEQSEIFGLFFDMLAEAYDQLKIEPIKLSLQDIFSDWAAAWAEFGPKISGLSTFQSLLSQLKLRIKEVCKGIELRATPVEKWLQHWLVEPAINIDALNQSNETQFELSQSSNTEVIAVSDKSFASQYTDSLPALLNFLGGTLAVTTYASNRLVLLRANGDELNTHFKEFKGPMGLAYDGQKMALGVVNGIWLFRSQADLCHQFDPPCDAVFVPYKQHMTGDVRIHELGWSNEQLWMVNTRFSCLASLDDLHSFVPEWHPPFIDQLQAEDACHLNGMAFRFGKPTWVSALGVSNQAAGWRDNKFNGGVVMDVAAGEVVTSGLCMPHSPRWHGDALWVLDSGRGGLCRVDINSGERDLVAQLPGFTRGLAFVDRYAFIGCSRVREKAWFGDGLPILNKEQAPECGIWAVDIFSGEIIAWLSFEEGIDEIFDVQWLPGLHWPDILEPDEENARNGFILPADHISKFQ